MKKIIVITILLFFLGVVSLASLFLKRLGDQPYEKIKYTVNAGITREVDNSENDEDESDYRANGIDDDQCSEESSRLNDLGIRKA